MDKTLATLLTGALALAGCTANVKVNSRVKVEAKSIDDAKPSPVSDGSSESSGGDDGDGDDSGSSAATPGTSSGAGGANAAASSNSGSSSSSASSDALIVVGSYLLASAPDPACSATNVGALALKQSASGSATGYLRKCYFDGSAYAWGTVSFANAATIGTQGPAGDPGDAGPTGAAGDAGDAGAQGPQGSQGPAGATGSQGAQGAAGSAGGAGAAGATGPAGTDHHDRLRQNARLSLSSSSDTPSTDQTGATSVYLVPMLDGTIAIFDGSDWVIRTLSSAVSVAVPSTANTNFDIFAYYNSGAIALETMSWSSDSSRATAIEDQQGVYVKSGDPTRRYLGTGRTTGVSGQTEDSLAKRFLWNHAQRRTRQIYYHSGTDYSYAAMSYRACNNSSANRVEVVVGLPDVRLDLMIQGGLGATVDIGWRAGIGLDRSSGFDNGYPVVISYAWGRQIAAYSANHAAGYHYFQCVEITDSTNTHDVDFVTIAGFVEG